jgi:hypothetical protein
MDICDGRGARFSDHGAAVKLIAVPPWQVEEVWPYAQRHVEAAVERAGLADVAVVLDSLFARRSLLWLAIDNTAVFGAGITELIDERAGRVCVIVAWGSDDQVRCAPLLETIEKFARDEDCIAVRLYGRPGWRRRLSEYRLKAVVMERPL